MGRRLRPACEQGFEHRQIPDLASRRDRVVSASVCVALPQAPHSGKLRDTIEISISTSLDMVNAAES